MYVFAGFSTHLGQGKATKYRVVASKISGISAATRYTEPAFNPPLISRYVLLTRSGVILPLIKREKKKEYPGCVSPRLGLLISVIELSDWLCPLPLLALCRVRRKEFSRTFGSLSSGNAVARGVKLNKAAKTG